MIETSCSSAGAGRYYDRSLFINSALETIKDYYETVATIQTCAVGADGPGCVAVLPTDPNAFGHWARRRAAKSSS